MYESNNLPNSAQVDDGKKSAILPAGNEGAYDIIPQWLGGRSARCYPGSKLRKGGRWTIIGQRDTAVPGMVYGLEGKKTSPPVHHENGLIEK